MRAQETWRPRRTHSLTHEEGGLDLEEGGVLGALNFAKRRLAKCPKDLYQCTTG